MPDPINPELDADRLAMNEIRDRLLEAAEEHDRRRNIHHDSQPCINFRCNAIAFLAHCIGLHQPHLPRVSEILETYEADHIIRRTGPGRDGHG